MICLMVAPGVRSTSNTSEVGLRVSRRAMRHPSVPEYKPVSKVFNSHVGNDLVNNLMSFEKAIVTVSFHCRPPLFAEFGIAGEDVGETSVFLGRGADALSAHAVSNSRSGL